MIGHSNFKLTTVLTTRQHFRASQEILLRSNFSFGFESAIFQFKFWYFDLNLGFGRTILKINYFLNLILLLNFLTAFCKVPTSIDFIIDSAWLWASKRVNGYFSCHHSTNGPILELLWFLFKLTFFSATMTGSDPCSAAPCKVPTSIDFIIDSAWLWASKRVDGYFSRHHSTNGPILELLWFFLSWRFFRNDDWIWSLFCSSL